MLCDTANKLLYLVDNRGGIKISDFGISKKVEDSKFRSSFCECNNS